MEGNRQCCLCTVQAEAEQSCRPASRSASEQTADAPGASTSGRGEAVHRQRRFVSFWQRGAACARTTSVQRLPVRAARLGGTRN